MHRKAGGSGSGCSSGSSSGGHASREALPPPALHAREPSSNASNLARGEAGPGSFPGTCL
ncbi:unnamed protein product [Diplocarpon coronariae]